MKTKKILGISLATIGATLTSSVYAAAGDPWNGFTDYNDFICKVWSWLATLIIPVATVVLIFAGFLWMTSEGSPEKITKAKEYIWGVASGVGLLLVSFFLLNNVLGISAIFILSGSCIWN